MRRTPVRVQLMMTDCAAACLAMVLSAHGRPTRIEECAAVVGGGRDGATARLLVAAARQFGLEARGHRVDETDTLARMPLPAIAHWQFDHFVVVDRVTATHVDIIDPTTGRRRLGRADFDAGFTGVLITCTPGAGFARDHPAHRAPWRRYARAYALAQPGLLGQILVASLLIQASALAAPLFAGTVVDGLVGGDGARLRTLGAGMLLVVAASVVVGVVRSLCLLHLQARADTALTTGFFDHLLSLPFGFFERRGAGDLIARLGSTTAVRETLTGQLLTTVLDGTTAVGLVAVVVALDPPTGLAVVAMGVAHLAVTALLGRRIREVTAAEVTADAAAQGYLHEAMTGVESVKAAGAERRVADHWRGLFRRRAAASLRRGKVNASIATAATAVRSLSPVLLLWMGGSRVLAGTMTPGEMIAANALAIAALIPLMSVVSNVQDLQFLAATLERLADVLDTEPERDGGLVVAGYDGSVELDGVGYRYAPQSPPVLVDCSIHLRAGSTVAIVGRSGSGKSTLAGLVLGLRTPTSGTVRYGGVDAADLHPQALRRRFGAVLQDPALFSGTIRSNIALSDPAMPIGQVVRAAQLAAIHDDVVAMPMGYDTQLADRGAGLSGGQRQRLALARALASAPAVLVLDEATSHLDSVTEARVDDAIRTVGCTRLIIAHRLSTVRHADEIIVLEAGRIVERGTHRSLLAAGGAYADLVAEQTTGTRRRPDPLGPASVGTSNRSAQ